jgi:hypothetical protein
VAAVASTPGTPTGPIAYSAPASSGAGVFGGAVYVAPVIPAPGVSPILNNPAAAGATAANMLPQDVTPAAIVRATA